MEGLTGVSRKTATATTTEGGVTPSEHYVGNCHQAQKVAAVHGRGGLGEANWTMSNEEMALPSAGDLLCPEEHALP